jgi:NO-binding membrane sensor protein with MHYT domain
MVVAGGLAFAIVAARWLGWMSFPLACLIFTGAMAGMHYLGLSALSNGYELEVSNYGLVIALAIGLQTSVAMLWFSFHERALFSTFLAAAALGLAISATNYSALEAITLHLPDGAAADQAGPAAGYALALSVAGAVYAICGFCIGIFALIGAIRRAGVGGRQSAIG